MMGVYKGACLNDPDPKKAKELGLEWSRGDFTVLDDADFGGMKIAWDCTSDYLKPILTVQNIQLVKTRSYYGGWFIIGKNEPNLNGVTPQQYVDLCIAQANIILAGDPNAQLCVWGGTAADPMYDDKGWFWTMWSLMPHTLKMHIGAICTDYYVQSEFPEDPSQWFFYKPLYEYFQKCRAALDIRLARRELWCVEVGLVNKPYVLANPKEAALYVDTAFHTLREFCTRAAWYLERQRRDDYLSFYDPTGQMTLAGQVFQKI